MQLKVNPERRKIILENMQLIKINSNESERSIAVIGEVVTATIITMRQAGITSAEFRAQNIFFSPDAKREFITDFELYANAKLFHIIEAKGSTGLAGAIPQIQEQLIKTKCNNGCITDGYIWQFVQLIDKELIFNGSPLCMPIQIDEIFARIFSALNQNI